MISMRSMFGRPVSWTAGKVQTFNNAFPWLGPLILNLSVVYFVVQVLVAAAWEHPYSWINNSISDLGNTSYLKHPYQHCQELGPAICVKKFSPLHDWMNAEFFLLGFVMLVGSILVSQEFRIMGPGRKLYVAWLAFAMVGIGGIGAAMVGWFPENTVSAMHILGAALAIGVGSAGIALLGWRLALPSYLKWPMRIVAPIAIVAGLLFAIHVHLGIGAGTMERIAQYPETLWLMLFGSYMSHNHYNRLKGKPLPHDP